MVKLRLQRYGAKKAPFYRIVAADSRSPRDGRFIERLGFYDAAKYTENIELNEERVKYWLEQGAQPSQTLQNILVRKGLLAAPAKQAAAAK